MKTSAMLAALTLTMPLVLMGAAAAQDGASGATVTEVARAPSVPPPLQAPTHPVIVMTTDDAGAIDRYGNEVKPLSVTIEVLHKRQKVWSDTLQVSARRGANFNQSKTEYAARCGKSYDSDFSGRGGVQSLRVSLSRQNWRERSNAIQLNVQLQGASLSCDQPGTDTVGMDRSVTLETGKTITVEGEGSLLVRLTAR